MMNYSDLWGILNRPLMQSPATTENDPMLGSSNTLQRTFDSAQFNAASGEDPWEVRGNRFQNVSPLRRPWQAYNEVRATNPSWGMESLYNIATSPLMTPVRRSVDWGLWNLEGLPEGMR